MSRLPLGEPGTHLDFTPASPSDRASHVRRSYSYQDYAAFSLLCASLLDKQYTEIWLEHHDDILAIRQDGRCDVYQVKTHEGEDAKWRLRDREIGKILGKFVALERKHGGKINCYYIYSNIVWYVPVEYAEDQSAYADSLPVLQQKLEVVDSGGLSEPYDSAFRQVLKASNATESELRAVIAKLHFKTGSALSRFRADAHVDLATADSRLALWTVAELRSLQQSLVESIVGASTADVPPLLLDVSALSSNGMPEAEMERRRVTTASFQTRIAEGLRQKRRRKNMLYLTLALIFVALLFVVRPVVWKSPLEQAVDTIKRTQGNILPPNFKEAVAIVRSAGAPLVGLNLAGGNLACQDMSELDLRRIDGRYLKATGIVLDHSLLSGAAFAHSEMNMAKFRYARMDGAMFDEANLLAANMFGVEARLAYFKNATLQGANLSQSFLSGANLSGANLTLAELVRTDLNGADLEGAELIDANISGAQLKGARHLTQAMLDQACNDPKRPPVLDEPLRQSNRPCFVSEQEEFERKIKRVMVGFVGANLATSGYCKKSLLEFRPPDSKAHPEGNMAIPLNFSEIDDPPVEWHEK